MYLEASFLKWRFFKNNLHTNRRILSYYPCCLAAWERWSEAEYSSAQFGAGRLLKLLLVSANCKKLPSSLTCHCCCLREMTLLPLPAQARAGGEKMMGFCWFLAPGPGSVPAACWYFYPKEWLCSTKTMAKYKHLCWNHGYSLAISMLAGGIGAYVLSYCKLEKLYE